MSKQRLQSHLRESRLTPWVGRVMLANAVVFVLLQTVLTAPAFVQSLQFVPDQALRHPWTFLSYMFVDSGALHLGGNLLLLFIFGPAVERRLGGRGFLLYYLYCGIGAAAFALGLSSFMPVAPVLGSSGAALGVALAFAVAWPDADAVLAPLPIRLSARALVVLLASADLVLALWLNGGGAHLGYLGGLAAGYVFFRVQSLTAHRQRSEPKAITRRPVMAPIPVRQGGTITEVRPALARPEPREEYPAEELDRVLDKISAFGLRSLTAAERRFLDEVSKRKRGGER
jgi:membrane associated rhomboid family serine protease